ncbi:MAG TPA: radical SAM protein [Alphaproteobacteria bacterium]|nr:radical SAM protein [Alphaproteobacteria bacterium]
MTSDHRAGDFFTFYPHVGLVRGETAVAIHDLFQSCVYWFAEKKIAEALACFAKGGRLAQIARATGVDDATLENYLAALAALDLGTRVAERTISDPFRPAITRAQAKEKGVFLQGGIVTIELANECIYKCPWCVAVNPLTATACSCGVWPVEGARLSVDERIFAIERLNEQGFSKLVIKGGEPLLEWKELLAIVEAATRLGMFSTIHTTGLPLDRDRIEALKGLRVHLVLMLAGSSEPEFDTAAGRRGSWRDLHHVLELLREGGISFSAKIPASIVKAEQAQEFAAWALDLGAAGVEHVIYAPQSEGATLADLRRVAAPSNPQDMAVGIDEFYKNAQCQSCLWHACFIASDGRVTPCIGIRAPLADLHEVRMTEVLRENRLANFQETTARRQVPACARCEFRFGCWSCLARTADCNGKATGRHWNCAYEPATATWIEQSALVSAAT